MVTNEPWAGLHGDLLAAKTAVYDPSRFVCSQPVPEPESAEYAAHAFTLDGLAVRFRVAKTTPTKVGQFVTVWQRSAEGPIRPFDAEDGVDLFVISSRDSGHFGQFVFPRAVLCERGIVSRGGSGGKRGFRVYPPWVTTTSRQAAATQAWQTAYFLHLGAEGGPLLDVVDVARAQALYHP
ncbi:MepB domain containing protein [Streptomyces cinnamoneus]|uniref:MepB domain containing protein n=1 Tax=Streptomyces cinnamoneus TaxID=53446 RepID=A0A2G1XKG7_STRCJ|nr:MepB family protein [Streptomyces cinnamoneus]PHQ48914.1 MepB domain containing protein [Streptomyces cinnamoneus]PHQ51639.1 MepB domain containing protein [Streptomyces cinnamoneus]PPT14437.1 MepB domain containing protein [Streptomyces cinnamoneus]